MRDPSPVPGRTVNQKVHRVTVLPNLPVSLPIESRVELGLRCCNKYVIPSAKELIQHWNEVYCPPGMQNVTDKTYNFTDGQNLLVGDWRK
jgi:hypothetical protein